MTPEEALGIKKPATEETLRSIDRTLKRIEAILLRNAMPDNIEIDGTAISNAGMMKGE